MSSIFTLFRSIWLERPMIGCAYFLMSIFGGAVSVLSLVVIRGVTNSLGAILANGQHRTVFISHLIGYLALQLVIEIATFITSQASTNVLAKRLINLTSVHMFRGLLKLLWSMKDQDIESSASYSQYAALEQSTQTYVNKVLPSAFIVLQSVISVILYIVIFSHFNIYMSVLVIALVLPSVFIDLKFAGQDITLIHINSKERMYSFRLLSLMLSKTAVRDIRMGGFGDFLFSRWRKLNNIMIDREIKLMSRQVKIGTVIQTLSLVLMTGAMLAVLVMRGANGATIGSRLAFLQAVGSMQQGFSSIFTSGMTLYIANKTLRSVYQQTMSNERTTHVKRYTEDDKLEAKHISFRYPGKSDWAIEDISTVFQPGESTALVGVNGSGKSTLIKCLLGHYAVQNGEILFPISTRGHESNIQAVFQDYVIYPVSILENVTMQETNTADEIDQVYNLFRSIGLDSVVTCLPNGINTVLDTTVESGGSLSHGELQKIAICRALFRQPRFLILDEPTASLDPISERKIYVSVLNMMRQRTVVFISHRLNICEIVSRVIVMDRGHVIDTGTHLDLLSRCDVYRALNDSITNNLSLNESSPLELPIH